MPDRSNNPPQRLGGLEYLIIEMDPTRKGSNPTTSAIIGLASAGLVLFNNPALLFQS